MSADDPTRIPVHVRRVIEADGTMHSENEIYCIARCRSIPVEECEDCTGYAGCDVDLANHRNYILCRSLTPETARAVGPARPIALRRRFLGQPTLAERTAVSTIMTADVWCAREELALEGVRALFAERKVSGAPVVDAAGRCIGVVSTTDLARARADAATVRDVMARVTFVLPDNASISQAAALMAVEHIHRVPIVTDDGRVAGIVSSIDVLGWLARQDGYVVPR